MVIALRLDKASRIHSMFFLQVLFGYVEDVLLFGIKLDFLDGLGASIIITCAILTVFIKHVKERESR